MEQGNPDVLVIGAGAAGLAAARDLAAEGLRVLVLEARERVGGRVHSLHDPASPLPVELGAEFIHGEPRETWAIVERARLPVCEMPGRHWQLRGGQLTSSEQFWSELEEVFARLKREGGRDLSFEEFLAEGHEDEQTRASARAYVEGFHAARAERAGTRGLLRAEEASDRVNGDRMFRFLGGYRSVVEHLRDEFERAGGEVLLGAAVEEIRWRAGRVEVFTRGSGEGVSHTARCCVVTLPLGLLQEGAVRFAPELPEKLKAARGVEIGHVHRVSLRFRERFWERLELPSTDGRRSLSGMSFLHAPVAALSVWWTALPVRAPLLVGWAGGTAADELAGRGDGFVIESALESLARVLGVARGEVEAQFEHAYTHDWQADPYARGAYSYLPVGGVEAQKSLAEPVGGVLFFAGEATNTDGHNGTVHGALATGQRAAREVLGSMSG